MPGRSVAINSYSYIWTHSAEQIIRHMAVLGYRSIELMVTPPHLWPSLTAVERNAIAHVLRSVEMKILSLNPPMLDLNLASPASEVRKYSLNHYRAVVDLAGEWDVPYVVVVPGKAHPLLPAPTDQRDAWLLEALTDLAGRASGCGVQILIENVPTSFLSTAGAIAKLLETLDHESVAAVYDVANAVFVGEDLFEGTKRLDKWMRLVHLSDTALDRWQHHRLGTGAVPLDHVSKALDQASYTGPVVLEIIAKEPDQDIFASHDVAFANGIVKRRTEGLRLT